MSLEMPKVPENNDATSALELKLKRLEESLNDIEETIATQMGKNPEIQNASYADDELEARENLLRSIKATKEALVQQRRAGFRIVQ